MNADQRRALRNHIGDGRTSVALTTKALTDLLDALDAAEARAERLARAVRELAKHWSINAGDGAAWTATVCADRLRALLADNDGVTE